MSRCCRTSSTGTSISALTPRTPIVPSRLANQPGAAMVKCHGSLSVIDGGAVSLGWSSIVPATRRPATTNAATAKQSGFICMGRCYNRRHSKPRKNFKILVNPHDLGTLEAKTGHETLLIESESVDAAMQGVGSEAPGHSLVHDHHAWTSADLPAARVVYPVHRLLVHQKKRVTVLLNAGLQAVG